MTTPLPDTAFEGLRAHLLEHSVKRGDFTLKSGRKSSWFIDSKQTVCRPEAMVLVVAEDSTDEALGALRGAGVDPVVVGRVEAGERGVDLVGPSLWGDR